MAGPSDAFTLGVEEEFFLIDPETRELSPDVSEVLPRAKEAAGDRVEPELHRTQIETGTEVCGTLEELRAELVRLRCSIAASARSVGKAIGASGTHPLADWRSTEVTPKAAYLKLERDYQQIAREQILCGCHVHVGMPDREEAVEVLNRVRPWLSVILALSVNSPFWAGVDTGYDSYRTEVWRRWPTSGTPHRFASRAEYDELIRTLLSTGSIDDPARIYWDVRLSARFETLEFRVTDVCLKVDEAVMVAALIRALARTCHRQVLDGVPGSDPAPELLRVATWRAARYGVQADLIDLERKRSLPALEVVRNLLALLEPALAEHGESEEVGTLVARTLSLGTGASRQRRALSRRGRFEDVVDLIVAETVCGC